MLSGSIIPYSIHAIGHYYLWHPCYPAVLFPGIHVLRQYYPLASMLSGSINPWYPCYPAVSPLAFMLSGSFTPGIHAIRQYYPLVSMLSGRALLSPSIHAIQQYYPLISVSIIPWYSCYLAVLSPGIHAVRQYYTLVSTLQSNFDLCFPEKEQCGLSPNLDIHVSVSNLHIPTISPPIFLQQNRQTDRGNM